MWLAASVMLREGVHVHPHRASPEPHAACSAGSRRGDNGLLGRGDAGTLFTTNIVSDPDDASPRQSRLM
jgi:hypothetical protein